MAALKSRDWPGNIRALENAIEHAVLLSDGPNIKSLTLPPEGARRETARRTNLHYHCRTGIDLRSAVETEGTTHPPGARPRQRQQEPRGAQLLGAQPYDPRRDAQAQAHLDGHRALPARLTPSRPTTPRPAPPRRTAGCGRSSRRPTRPARPSSRPRGAINRGFFASGSTTRQVRTPAPARRRAFRAQVGRRVSRAPRTHPVGPHGDRALARHHGHPLAQPPRHVRRHLRRGRELTPGSGRIHHPPGRRACRSEGVDVRRRARGALGARPRRVIA